MTIDLNLYNYRTPDDVATAHFNPNLSVVHIEINLTDLLAGLPERAHVGPMLAKHGAEVTAELAIAIVRFVEQRSQISLVARQAIQDKLQALSAETNTHNQQASA